MDKLYRIQIWVERSWVWGINDYTWFEAVGRAKRLKAVGIKSRIRPNSELFN